MTAHPNIEHLHNQLIAGIYGNVSRDSPEPGVAPWVSANDKPTVVSKPVSGDAAEQRLKTEIMQLPGRERRRLKEIPNVSSTLSRPLALSMVKSQSSKILFRGRNGADINSLVFRVKHMITFHTSPEAQ